MTGRNIGFNERVFAVQWSNMRIGIDGSRAFDAQRTGTEEYSYQMIRHLAQLPESSSCSWTIYTRPGQDPDIDLPRNWKIVPIQRSSLWTQVGLAARTWQDKLDVLWVPAHTLPVFRPPRLKTVVTIHGIEYEWLPAYENALQRWYLPWSTVYATHTATRIISVSQFTKDQLVKRLGVLKDRVEVIHEGFLPFKGSTGGRESDVLKKNQLKPHNYLLFIGTIQPRKNLVRLIDAFSRLHTTADLVICGKWGWSYEEVRKAPSRYGVDGRVKFTGYVLDKDRDALLQSALVYVQSSITEGFGLPVLEAMAAGIPVVSSQGGALPEVVGDAGILVDPEDAEGLAQALQRVLDDISLRSELVRAGKKRVEEFSWKRAAQLTLSVLTSIR